MYIYVCDVFMYIQSELRKKKKSLMERKKVYFTRKKTFVL